MDILVDFLLNNYIWFLVMSLILIFALIGYLVDTTTSKANNTEMKVKPIVASDNESEKAVHPSLQVYTNEEFDDPLINDKNV